MSTRASILSLRLRPILSLLLASAGGCVGEEDDPGALVVRTSAGGGNTCSTCNLNSPRLNDFGIAQVHRLLPNESGVVWLGVENEKGELATDAWVEDGVLWVHHNGKSIGASDLVGWKLSFETPDGAVSVEIADISKTPGLAPDVPNVPTYALRYAPDGASPGEVRSVCPSYLQTPDEAVVVLIDGETYDRATNDVLHAPDWLTLACADEAVYKMMRLGYGPDADFAGTGGPATIAQRAATIRMITADYCGTGHSFTEPNTPLVWINYSASIKGDGGDTPLTLEAYWSEHGAACLDTTRLVLTEKVETYCDIPSCSWIDPATLDYEWVTMVPQ